MRHVPLFRLRTGPRGVRCKEQDFLMTQRIIVPQSSWKRSRTERDSGLRTKSILNMVQSVETESMIIFNARLFPSSFPGAFVLCITCVKGS